MQYDPILANPITIQSNPILSNLMQSRPTWLILSTSVSWLMATLICEARSSMPPVSRFMVADRHWSATSRTCSGVALSSFRKLSTLPDRSSTPSSWVLDLDRASRGIGENRNVKQERIGKGKELEKGDNRELEKNPKR